MSEIHWETQDDPLEGVEIEIEGLTFAQFCEDLKAIVASYNLALSDTKQHMANQLVEGTGEEIRDRYQAACVAYRNFCEKGIEALSDRYHDVKVTPEAENGFITGIVVVATPNAMSSSSQGRRSSSSSSSSAAMVVSWTRASA